MISLLPFEKYDAQSLVGDCGQKRFHAMAKLVGSICNLDCTYCYYLSKKYLARGSGTSWMLDETFELFIKQYIDGVTGDEVVFSWQGGEPTLLGLDFFRHRRAAGQFQRRHAALAGRDSNDDRHFCRDICATAMLGYSLLLSVWNIGLMIAGKTGPMLYEHLLNKNINSLICLNAGVTLAGAPFVFILTKPLVEKREGK